MSKKQKILHGPGPSSINLVIFVFSLKFAGFHNHFLILIIPALRHCHVSFLAVVVVVVVSVFLARLLSKETNYNPQDRMIADYILKNEQNGVKKTLERTN